MVLAQRLANIVNAGIRGEICTSSASPQTNRAAVKHYRPMKMVCLIGVAPTRDFSHYSLKVARLLITPQTHEKNRMLGFRCSTTELPHHGDEGGI